MKHNMPNIRLIVCYSWYANTISEQENEFHGQLTITNLMCVSERVVFLFVYMVLEVSFLFCLSEVFEW